MGIRRNLLFSLSLGAALTFHLGPGQLTDKERAQIRLAQIRVD